MPYDGKILSRAMARFDEDKQRRARQFRERQQQLFAREPELADIDRRLRGTMSQIITRALKGGRDPVPAIHAIRDENLALQRRREELLTAALEGQILVPDGVDGRHRVPAPLQGPGDDLAHGAAQAAVDVRQLRLPGKQLLLTLPELPGPALLILVKAGHGPAENFSVVGHGVPSFTDLYYHFMYFSMRELS